MFPDLKSCCGVMSVKTGTFFIAMFNQSFAVLGFVAFISAFVIVMREATDHRTHLMILIMVGVLATAAYIIMGGILVTGLQKEKPAHLRKYLIIGPGVITFNMLLLGSSSYLLHWSLAIPCVLGMAAQVYFLLVIRSAYKEMVLEERMFEAARNNMEEIG